MNEIEKDFDPYLKGKNTEKDFTFDAYINYLINIKKQYTFILYDQLDLTTPSVLWRHDVDVSIHNAYKLSKIEKEIGVQATYFIMLGSWFYDFRDFEIQSLIASIQEEGHSIGLHYDFEYLPAGTVSSFETFLTSLEWQKKEIESMLGREVKAFSFHNPSLIAPDLLKEINRTPTFFNMVNVYNDFIFQKFKYCSDSNGIWRFERLDALINNSLHPHLHILTHPEWWTQHFFSPRQKIENSLWGRARCILKRHDDNLAENKRPNF